MDVSKWDHCDFFASNVLSDVCAYFLQTLYNEERGCTTRRGLLYSEYGQKTLLQCLENLPLQYFMDLKYDERLHNIDDFVFKQKVTAIIAKNDWNFNSHATFYETCAKIAILGLAAMEYGRFNGDKIHTEIANVARQAYAIHKLDEHYDMARKNAHSIFYSVFKILGTDIGDYISPVERLIGGFEDFIFPNGLVNWIVLTGKNSENLIASDKNFKIMNKKKFHCLAKRLFELYKRNKEENRSTSNAFVNFLGLAINIGTVSLYCAKNSFPEGVQLGFDRVVELVLMEKRLSLFTDRSQAT